MFGSILIWAVALAVFGWSATLAFSTAVLVVLGAAQTAAGATSVTLLQTRVPPEMRGRAMSLKEFKGKALALTFIFTRCPFPEFCPRMSNNFAEAYKRLMTTPNAPTNWHLLSISFDPANDTPAVLKAYAGRYNYDSNYWSFVTGAMIDIDAITEQFGLGFSRQGASINHNLRTVVVDANGRVRRILTGNDWKPAELVEEIGRAALGLPSAD